jgi:hypothetical protein
MPQLGGEVCHALGNSGESGNCQTRAVLKVVLLTTRRSVVSRLAGQWAIGKERECREYRDSNSVARASFVGFAASMVMAGAVSSSSSVSRYHTMDRALEVSASRHPCLARPLLV